MNDLITDQLGAPADEVFASFDPVPVASASIAQVHHATLHTGERVVVKVQRPGIKARLAADLQILERAAKLFELHSYGKVLNAREVVDDFAANLRDELDFHTEATNIADWRASLAAALEKEGHAPASAASLATLVIASVEGAVVLCRAQRSIEPFDRVARQLQAMVKLTSLCTASAPRFITASSGACTASRAMAWASRNSSSRAVGSRVTVDNGKLRARLDSRDAKLAKADAKAEEDGGGEVQEEEEEEEAQCRGVRWIVEIVGIRSRLWRRLILLRRIRHG